MQVIAEIFITDKTGQEFFRTSCNPDFVDSEERNLKRHLSMATVQPAAYHFLDVETAEIKTRFKRIGL